MKAIKGLSLFAGLVVLASSCFNPPEFPLEPKIEFADIYFGVTPDALKADSIVVSIDFKDGDGDLGLAGENVEATNPEDFEFPFHRSNLFLGQGGALVPVGVWHQYSNLEDYFVLIDKGQQGKLMTLKMSRLPEYSSLSLPLYSLGSCHYLVDTILVDERDAAIVDQNYQNIIDTLHSPADPSIFVLRDTFYIAPNPNYFNITVDFLYSSDGENFLVYDWGECISTYDGRFPVLSDKKDSPLEGTLKYSLKSFGFENLFSTKILKLRIQIKDKALHSSNIIETPKFTLAKIRR